MATETLQPQPRARSHIIERPRITKLLDETKAPTILLVAPAGFGKTTLARQWLDPRPHGWYRGSQASTDYAALAAGVAQAAAEIVPGAGKRMMERLGLAAPPPKADTLAGMLAEDLAGWPEEAWVAVDDYHFAMESPASEAFLEELILRSPLRLLVTSRTRPGWATARRMLYGEIFEVGRSALALTHDEAGTVLAGRRAEEIAGLMALTEGWPAVIGLASLSSEPVVSEAVLPDTLYEYCAEELFQKFPRELRLGLCTIALAPSISVELLRELFGEKATRIAAAAEEGGFVTRAKGGDLDMQPLLRAFLLAKLDEEPPARTVRMVHELASQLARARRWNDALAVLRRSQDFSLVEELIDSAMDELLTQGRLETLQDWLKHARSLGNSPILDLVDAELAFRGGDHSHASMHSLNAASGFVPKDNRISRAWYRASLSAYFLDQPEDGFACAEQAQSAALSPEDRKNALWSLFHCGTELDDRNADRFLEEIRTLRPLTLADEIRLTGGELFFATRWGRLESAIRKARSLVRRLDGVDPLVQTGFLNNYAHSLVLTARYSEALDAARFEAEQATKFRLDFVVPHSHLVEAQALIGLRRFREARAALEKAKARDDPYVPTAVLIFQSKIEMQEHSADEALASLARAWDAHPASPSLRAEISANEALALAAAGRLDEALAKADRALKLSAAIEGLVLQAGARAIVALKGDQPDAQLLARSALALSLELGNVDTLVCVYRASPAVLTALTDDESLREDVMRLLEQASDLMWARRTLEPSLFASRDFALSPREVEVLNLVAQGLTNRQIAQRLFIAEVTVKVHVRHILRKLGVRTRTEAAVLAARSAIDASG